MAELVVVYILDDYEVGKRFTMWPLHVTLLPWFEVGEISEAERALRDVLIGTEPVSVQLGDYSTFGKSHTARQLINNPQLQELHTILLNTVEGQGWHLGGRYVGSHFTPHITSKAGRSYEGDSFVINRVQIVESLPQGYRRVVSELALKEQK